MKPEAIAPNLIVEVLDETGIRHIDAAQWDELARNGLDDNPFYARSYVLAGLNTGKGCLRFRKSTPIDWALIEKLLRDTRGSVRSR